MQCYDRWKEIFWSAINKWSKNYMISSQDNDYTTGCLLDCYVYPSCSTILFVFLYPTSVVFMLLHYFTTTPSKSIPFISCTLLHLIHFIYIRLFHLNHYIGHNPSLSYLPYLVILMLHRHSVLLSWHIKMIS